MFYYFFGLPLIATWALFSPDKSKKPMQRIEIDLNAPVVGWGVDRPPKDMSMSDWKNGKMKL
jgi:hypothetical protein